MIDYPKTKLSKGCDCCGEEDVILVEITHEGGEKESIAIELGYKNHPSLHTCPRD